ncbi:hypothetical protein JCM3774_004335 [Rhodotorula dairenensis]
MLASLWNWIAPPATPPSSAAQPPRPPSPAPLPASTIKNRKKRQQKKKKAAARHRDGDRDRNENADGDDGGGGDGEDDEREPDELLWNDEERSRRLQEFPDADDDQEYLSRLDPSPSPSGLSPSHGAADSSSSSSTSAKPGAGADADLSARTKTTTSPARPTTAAAAAAAAAAAEAMVPPESLAVDDLVASMLAQGKTHPGPTGPLQRVHNLPDGAGQAPGLPQVRSTAESRKKAIEHGLVPITDEHGTLRVGFRIRKDIVLMHPKDLKGEPVLLRM